MPSTAWPIISDDPQIQANYEESRELGTSHNLAEMFALAQPPGSDTDREFLAGHCNGNQFEGQDDIAEEYKQTAAAAGVNVKGKVYLGGLAKFPGDPKAWVDGKGDVKKVLEERGWGARGSVNVKAQEVEPVSGVPVADDIIEREVNEIMAFQEDAGHVDREDLKEQVKAKRKPYWAKK